MESNNDNANTSSKGAQGSPSNQRSQQGQRSNYANPYHKKKRSNQRSAEQIKEFGTGGDDTRSAPRHKAGFRNEPSINKPLQPQPQATSRPQQQGPRPQQSQTVQGQSQPSNANASKAPVAPQQNTSAPRPINAGQPQRSQQGNNQRPTQNQPVQGAQRNSNIQNAQPVKPIRRWEDHKIKIEETYEDIKRENERIEKEIWLEIAEIHNAKLD